MEGSHHYLELKNPIRFDSASQLTNVYFDDSNKQIFAVRSNGATGVVVKSYEDESISFCMDDQGPIKSIKFCADNKILAVQRTDSSVEFITFHYNQPILSDIIVHNSKNSFIYGFVWIHDREVALISNGGVEIFLINMEKKQIKLMKSLIISVKWFSWCPEGNLAILATNNGAILNPVILKPKTITKLPRLEVDSGREVPERDVTLGVIYSTLAILILKQTQNRLVEVVIYLLNGPGLAPQMQHILRIGHSGPVAVNIVDNLIIVHHQSSGTSMIYDVALCGEKDADGICQFHAPITLGKPIRPFALKLPSISPDGQSMNCELYSENWVLFQPNIVIDAKLGCLWYLYIKYETLCMLITDRVRLVEFLLQRTVGKQHLLNVLRQILIEQYNGMLLPIIERIFDKINAVYEIYLRQNNTPPSASKTVQKIADVQKVVITQEDMIVHIFSTLTDKPHAEKVLLFYIQSLSKHKILAKEDLSKMICLELIRSRHFDTLQQLIDLSLLLESVPMSCFLLSHSKDHPSIGQMALDMIKKLNASEIILEVLLEQGKVVDALRIAKALPNSDTISARKYLEAAMRTEDEMTFYATFRYFQHRNLLLRGSRDFLKGENCLEFVQHYYNTFVSR